MEESHFAIYFGVHFLRPLGEVIQVLPNLDKYTKKVVALGRRHCIGLKKS